MRTAVLLLGLSLIAGGIIAAIGLPAVAMIAGLCCLAAFLLL
ncbi:hypothetical protein ACFLEY_21750 [Bradyrhizobium sp. YCK136]|uniref:Uncharacterized protein n=1 Tax=Bradyrhizobium diazoefficiens TaxID=1355477 RepID=A0A0E4BWE6_9BRAD|nr:hypothetical protein [Bradyrhizobium diazoefficiens]BAR61811.1 hypothetical protein NK6_8662 [Bradyrhizobium diazoefficiens]